MTIKPSIAVFNYTDAKCKHGDPATSACSFDMLYQYKLDAEAAAKAAGYNMDVANFRFQTYVWPEGDSSNGWHKPNCSWSGLGWLRDPVSYVHDGYPFQSRVVMHEWG
jgi:hypothetical protein